MKFKAFKKIGQFKDIIKSIRLQAQFVGLDENNVPIYDETKQLPTIVFKGTVKLHGTSASFNYSKSEDKLLPQKRSSIIEDDFGHFGFVEYTKANEVVIKEKMSTLCNKLGIDSVVVFGEWCGTGVQKKVAISELPKRMVIFEAWNPVTEEYIDTDLLSDFCEGVPKCYNVRDYQTFEMEVDTQYPEIALGKINDLVDEVEKSCPVAKAMLLDEFPDKCVDRTEYIGEGIVWKYKDICWKAKGSKHSNSSGGKIKATVDPIKAQNIKDFVEATVTEYRLEQCYSEIKSNHGEVEMKHLGELMKWIFSDIMTEEGDALQHNNLDKKDIGGAVANKARPWFTNKINSF